MSSANEIIKGIWIGDMNSAVDPYFFKKNNIKAVVNCTPDIETPFKVEYLRLNLDDSLKKKDTYKMIEYMPHAIHFIDKKRRENKNVLIHEAINLILKKRPMAFHNGRHVNFSEALVYHSKKY